MQEKDCKSGTEVIIRGTIVAYGLTGYRPVSVNIAHDGVRDFSIESLEPVQLKYDPAREFRKGDIVRFIYRGRKSYVVAPGDETECTVHEDERQEQVLIKWRKITVSVHFSDLVLVKPIEEIEAEAPYFVKRENNVSAFSIDRKDRTTSIITVWFGDSRGVTSEEAEKKAQKICDELNREHRESLDA